MTLNIKILTLVLFYDIKDDNTPTAIISKVKISPNHEYSQKLTTLTCDYY
jgi:hypothetical protein